MGLSVAKEPIPILVEVHLLSAGNKKGQPKLPFSLH